MSPIQEASAASGLGYRSVFMKSFQDIFRWIDPPLFPPRSSARDRFQVSVFFTMDSRRRRVFTFNDTR